MSIEIRALSKTHKGCTYIKPTNVRFTPNHFNVLLGATGAGKTTLMKLMAGLDTASNGQVLINDVDVTRLSPRQRNIGFVHQFFMNYPHMTVFENIASPLRVSGAGDSTIQRAVHDMADLLQLGGLLQRRPQHLSGGQHQRTALARALVKQSAVVFLDEPLVNLDYKLREELRTELPKILAGRGTTVVYATSEPIEALLLGGQIALMHNGSMLQCGDTLGVYRNPQTLLSAQVFSDPPINIATLTKQNNHAYLSTGIQWLLPPCFQGLADGHYQCAVRPDAVLPFATEQAHVAIDGHVDLTEINGSNSSAHFHFLTDHGQSTPIHWVSLSGGIHSYDIGKPHRFYLDPSACFLFSAQGHNVAELSSNSNSAPAIAAQAAG